MSDTQKTQANEDAGPLDQRKPTIAFQLGLIALVWTPLLVWLYGFESTEIELKVGDNSTMVPVCGVPILTWLRVMFTVYLVNSMIQAVFIKYIFVPQPGQGGMINMLYSNLKHCGL